MTDLREIRHLGVVHQPKGAVVVFGGQAGSEGKGAIVGYLARKYVWGAAIANFGPNTGHTFTSDDGVEYVVSQIPQACVNPSIPTLCLGPQSVIDVKKLLAEIETMDALGLRVSDRLRIHPRAVLVQKEHKRWEKENLQYISSTGKGTGAALGSKIARDQKVKLARDEPFLNEFITDTAEIVNDQINSGMGVLVEQAQGFDLDMNFGYQYPYCTGRQTTPQQALADSCIAGDLCTRSIAVVRTYPIRVGNVADFTSGDYGSKELDWNIISGRIGREVEEVTTVTKRVRRVFEFDWNRITTMSKLCRPTDIALTFADYLDPELRGLGSSMIPCMIATGKYDEYDTFVYKLLGAIGRPTGTPKISMVKTGPLEKDIFSIFSP